MSYTKSFLKLAEKSDGTRISVMSRHTCGDGVTPDPRIEMSGYDIWLSYFGAPPKLIGDYLKRGLSFDAYAKNYLDYLREESMAKHVLLFGQRCLEIDVTLLWIELEPDFCHRRLLAEECKRLYPQLIVEHR